MKKKEDSISKCLTTINGHRQRLDLTLKKEESEVYKALCTKYEKEAKVKCV